MFFDTFIKIFLLSLLLSTDELIAGVSYGLRKTTIPLKNLIFLVLGSASSFFIIMLLGAYLSSFFHDMVKTYLSFFLLAGLGCWIFIKACQDRNKPVQEMKHPEWGKSISIWDYICLGASLGIDDSAEAVALAVAGFPIILTVIILQVSEVLAIWIGSYIGNKQLSRLITPRLSFIPGLTVIGIAIWQLFK